MRSFYRHVIALKLQDHPYPPKERKKGTEIFPDGTGTAEVLGKKNADASKSNENEDDIDAVDDKDLPDDWRNF